MVPARYTNLLASGSTSPGSATDVDIVTVQLRNPLSPNNVVYTTNAMLKTNGDLLCVFPTSSLNNSYYIVVSHKSCLPLWSANPVLISSLTTYNFTDLLSKAYSDGFLAPMKQVGTGVYTLLIGEIYYDDYIDAIDYSVFDEQIISSSLGNYLLNSDFNGNSFVDASDFPIYDYNSQQGFYTQRP